MGPAHRFRPGASPLLCPERAGRPGSMPPDVPELATLRIGERQGVALPRVAVFDLLVGRRADLHAAGPGDRVGPGIPDDVPLPGLTLAAQVPGAEELKLVGVRSSALRRGDLPPMTLEGPGGP